MEKLIASMIRFSNAITLLGLEQLESAVSSMGGGEDLTTAMDKFGRRLDSITDAISSELDDKKRATLNSMNSVSDEYAHRTLQGVNFLNPTEAMRFGFDVTRKTVDSVTGMLTRSADSAGEASKAGEPQRGADALSKKRKESK